jgi:hypothetical protein
MSNERLWMSIDYDLSLQESISWYNQSCITNSLQIPSDIKLKKLYRGTKDIII